MAPGTIAGCCGPSLQTTSQRHEMNAGSSGGGSSSSSTATTTNLTTEVVLVVARSRRRTLSSMENWVQCLPLLCMCTPMRMSSGSSNPTSEFCTTREQVSGNSAADAGDESEPAGCVVGDYQQSGSSRFSDETTGGRTATKKHRIPELKACPPAPRKPRAIARKRVQPIRFFTSPELEAFFSQYKLQTVKF